MRSALIKSFAAKRLISSGRNDEQYNAVYPALPVPRHRRRAVAGLVAGGGLAGKLRVLPGRKGAGVLSQARASRQ